MPINKIKNIFSTNEKNKILSQGGKVIQTKKDINGMEFWMMLIPADESDNMPQNNFTLTF